MNNVQCTQFHVKVSFSKSEAISKNEQYSINNCTPHQRIKMIWQVIIAYCNMQLTDYYVCMHL